MQMEQDRQTFTTPQENSKKKVGQVWKITIFWRQAALFHGDSMQAITKRFLRGCPRPAPGRYYPFFRLLRASAVQKV
jgi:hypothetical protein